MIVSSHWHVLLLVSIFTISKVAKNGLSYSPLRPRPSSIDVKAKTRPLMMHHDEDNVVGSLISRQRRNTFRQIRNGLIYLVGGGSVFGINSSRSNILHSTAWASISNPNSRSITTVMLNSPSQSLGIQLFDVTIGSPSKLYPAVRSINPTSTAFKLGVQPGMILLGDYPNGSKDVIMRIRNGPYPIIFEFFNLAADGDAIGDLGLPIVSAEDALTMARQASSKGQQQSDGGATVIKGIDASPEAGLITNTVRKPSSSSCAIKSRRGDVMEIHYEARINNENGITYDSSYQRGTGQPYQFVLGNGDVIKGVDLGLYDMCPGEIRELNIPSVLGYGKFGSRLFDIPGNVRLWWKVELVRLNFIGEDNNTRERDQLYDGASGEL